MKFVVLLKKTANRESFIRALEKRGIVYAPMKLPRYFIVTVESVRDFPMTSRMVEDYDAAELPLIRHAQAMDINEGIDNFNWGIARVIRRGAPWETRPVKFPASTFFDSVRDGSGVDVYVVDSGCKTGHVEFGGRVTQFYEAVSSGGLEDDNGHGTHVMSQAIGETCGIARGSLGWACKVAGSTGSAEYVDLIEGLGEVLSHYESRAGTNRPAVLNISFAAAATSMEAAVTDCLDAGIVVCASAGNDNADMGTIVVSPAELAGVIAVAGSSPADAPYYIGTSGTNWSASIVDIVAPAQWTRGAAITGDGESEYRSGRSGTSYSSPLVAGAVACLLQGHGRLTNATEVEAVVTHLKAIATTGKLNTTDFDKVLPDRLLYLDPLQAAPEPITGL